MSFLICFAVVSVVSVLLRKPVHRVSWAFYAACILLDVLALSMRAVSLPHWLVPCVSFLMQRGNLGMALFALVMLIGVFPRGGRVSKWLRPIRAELSIMACLLIAGHMVLYIQTYLPRLVSGAGMKGNVMASFFLACALLALVVVLGVTSFRFVKRHMKARSWKKLQSLAYLFYALVFVHLMLMLVPSALRGSSVAVVQVTVYTAFFVAYVVARAYRAVVDKREKIDLAQTIKDQGFSD